MGNIVVVVPNNYFFLYHWGVQHNKNLIVIMARKFQETLF